MQIKFQGLDYFSSYVGVEFADLICMGDLFFGGLNCYSMCCFGVVQPLINPALD